MVSAQPPGNGEPPPGYGEFPPGYSGPPPGHGTGLSPPATPNQNQIKKSKFCGYGTCACIADILVSTGFFFFWLGVLLSNTTRDWRWNLAWGLLPLHLLGLGIAITYLVLATRKTNRVKVMLRVCVAWLILDILQMVYELVACIIICDGLRRDYLEKPVASDSRDVSGGLTEIFMITFISAEVLLMGGYIATVVVIVLNMKALGKAVDAEKRNEGTGAANYENTQN